MAVCVGDATQLDVRYLAWEAVGVSKCSVFLFYFNVMTYIIPAL